MKLWLASILYFGIPIIAGIGVVYAYVAITGDEYGEKLVPLTQQISTYPYGPPPYDPSKYGNNTNTNITTFNNEEGTNYTLPSKINATTSRNQQQQEPKWLPPGSKLPYQGAPGNWFGTSANKSTNAGFLYSYDLANEEEQYKQRMK